MTSDFLAGIHTSWRPVFDDVATTLADIENRLDDESRRGIRHAPPRSEIFRAFRVPLESVRVVILGQDPYPTPGHAVGWSFSTSRDVRPLPRSLANIYAELHTDLGITPADHGDLSSWVDQGVLLLNAALTVREGEAGSHRSWPWKTVAGAALTALAGRDTPPVAVLWGNDARWAEPILTGIDLIKSAHPSPLSARRGFFGSRPFSRINTSLSTQGSTPIDWRV